MLFAYERPLCATSGHSITAHSAILAWVCFGSAREHDLVEVGEIMRQKGDTVAVLIWRSAASQAASRSKRSFISR
jgi:hypothetical protein